MSFDDWMLALHVLSGFALVAGVILFWVLIVAVRQANTAEGTLRLGPLTRVADASVAIGAGGTIVLGVWLAFSVGGYDIWDGWIIAALLLWFLVADLGRRANAVYGAAVSKALELREAGRTDADTELAALNRSRRGLVLQVLITASVLLIVLDMIWKPGA